MRDSSLLLRARASATRHAMLSPGESFAAGCAAGACEAVAMMPLEVLKTRQQQAVTGPSSSSSSPLAHLRAAGGPLRGLTPMLLQTSVKVGIRMSVFDSLRRRMGGGDFLSGFVAGMVEALVWVTPLERIKCLRIRADSSSVREVVRNTYRAQGVRGFYQGGGATILRNATVVATRMEIFQRANQGFQQILPSKDLAVAVSGFTAGLITTILSNPLDVLKTNMNMHTERISNPDMLRLIYSRRGWRGFTEGITARVLKISMGQAIIFSVFSKLTEAHKAI